MRTVNQIVCAISALLSLALAGCGQSGDSAAEENGSASAAEVTLNLTLAPTEARCVVVTATPQTGTAVTRQISISPGQATVFNLSGLPTGVVTLTEQAYTAACASVTSTTTATWVSDPVVVTLAVGSPTNVTFNLRRADAGGKVTVSSDSRIDADFSTVPHRGEPGWHRHWR